MHIHDESAAFPSPSHQVSPKYSYVIQEYPFSSCFLRNNFDLYQANNDELIRLRKDQEDLLVLLSDQDGKIKRLTDMLQAAGLSVSAFHIKNQQNAGNCSTEAWCSLASLSYLCEDPERLVALETF